MRILVTIAHYYKAQPVSEWQSALGSGRDSLSRIAALNSEIVALHRYFGPHRDARDSDLRSQDTAPRNTLDIVVMTVRDANVLDQIGIDPSQYLVEYFDGDPIMLAFEAQRIMREREGAYDLYVYLEDDLTIVDPAFFDKIIWFTETFGSDVMLMPTRYEMAHSGVPARIEFSPRLGPADTSLMQHRRLAPVLEAQWNGRAQTFRLPNNPHSACFVITAEQLKRWIALPTFYDRDVSFCDPLVSAATYAPSKVFGIYRPAEPDPWFLAIEHYGTRYASGFAKPGQLFGESPLLALAERLDKGPMSDARGDTINSALARAFEAQYRLEKLQGSRNALAKALLASLWKKKLR